MYKLNKMFAPFMDADKGGNGAVNEVQVETQTTNEAKAEAKAEVPSEKTFTQAELDAIIEKRIARERSKFEKEIADKKFAEGMSEAEKLAKMTASEKREYELQKKIEAFEARERELSMKALQSESKGILAEMGYSNEDIKQLNGFINYEDADKCKASIEALDKVIKGLVDSRVEAEINAKIKNHTKPQGTVTSNGKITWADVLNNPKLMGEYRKQQNK